ncbi:DeoR/GlpR family DNA-binding transcription regulator [Pseudomonas sp. GX19020]|uniref:DeoR/GlpR family DNA-binding transcription regulator n=1 Tax=Pseudomonas sp. GX19020 TaxID=2942277 RepID=UPI0020187B8E|nr:DeoR/GlpR family DNA-binding transcription regulator [Pseudomonas sp. GX19020]MCL4067811.1 DeoR/GlpR family DNA-binding transcription regulator [Pseudomonas sp. GX19020]
MDHSPRHGQILAMLSDQGTVGINELAARLRVSAETIRRDVKSLAAQGEIVRMHGMVGLASTLREAPFERRMRENRAAKDIIVRRAAATIRDGDSVMLDTGTTTSLLARALLQHHQLVVVTNSSDIARTLATVNGNQVYMAGGRLRSDSGASFGVSAIDFISRFSVDHAVISAGAMDALTGVMDYDLEEAEFALAMLRCGRRRVVVTDATKFGVQGLVQVCGFDAIDEVICDLPPPPDLEAALQAEGVLIRASD